MDDKKRLVKSREPEKSCWEYVLCTLIFLWAGVFIAVAVITYQDMSTLDDNDIKLKTDIAKLIHDLEMAAIPGDVKDDPSADESDVVSQTLTTDYSNAMGSSETDEHNQLVGENGQTQMQGGQRKKRSTSIIEEILRAQEAVFEKYCHSWNATCPNGARGNNGTTGPQGLRGPNGTVGDPGRKGEVGSPGTAGLKGETGDQGLQGATGANGTQGPSGTKGSRGQKGDPGLRGTPGLKGEKGSEGQMGQKGQVGPAGVSGFAGANGIKGTRGGPGPKGSPGNTGPLGDNGQDVKKIADGCRCLGKPVFRSSLTSISIAPHGNATLPCDATGDPAPKLSVRKVQPNGKRSIRVQGTTATITDAGLFDFGAYQCEATNMYGSVNKTMMVLRQN